MPEQAAKTTMPSGPKAPDAPSRPPTISSAPQKKEKEQPQLRGWKRFWVEYLRPFLLVLVVLTAARSSLLDWNDVPTGSMKPSIIEGDRILVNKLAYDFKIPYWTWDNKTYAIAKWGDPKPGEIVVFYSPKDGIRLVKRVVAGPGDTVQLINERLFINGVAAQYGPLEPQIASQVTQGEQQTNKFYREKLGNNLNHPVMFIPGRTFAANYGPVTVPAGHYFMMGDNRDNSADSRFIGPVPRESIVGRASRVALSVDPSNWYMPRFVRFFRSLP
jgi:signal peptidase I